MQDELLVGAIGAATDEDSGGWKNRRFNTLYELKEKEVQRYFLA